MPPYDSPAWMWEQACQLLQRADRMHQQFFKLGQSSGQRPTWEPPIDVFETDSEIFILVALPGVAAEHVRVIADGGTLIVSAERRIPLQPQNAVIHRLEIPHGRLERRIELPAMRLELNERSLINGCLLLTLRKLG